MFFHLYDSSVCTSNRLERYEYVHSYKSFTKVITNIHAFYKTCELVNPEIARYEKVNLKRFWVKRQMTFNEPIHNMEFIKVDLASSGVICLKIHIWRRPLSCVPQSPNFSRFTLKSVLTITEFTRTKTGVVA